MLPCSFYTQKDKIRWKNPTFECPRSNENEDGFFFNNDTEHHFDCPFFKFCQKAIAKYNNFFDNKKLNKETGELEKTYITGIDRKINATVNIYPNGKKEIIYYKNTLKVPIRNESIKRPKKWHYDEKSRLLTPISRDATLRQYEKTIKKSGSRASDNIYGYIFSNTWRYFVTLTYSKEFVDRYDDEAVKEQFGIVRRKLMRYDPNAQYIAVAERQDSDGCLHFHMLLNMRELPIVSVPEGETWNKDGSPRLPQTDYRYYLFPVFEDGKWKKSDFNGHNYFAVSFHTVGRNWTGILDEGDNAAAANYIAKYVQKGISVGYGKKKFFHNRGLKCKEKFTAVLTEAEVERYGLIKCKETDTYTVFRNFNTNTGENKK